MLFRSVQSLSVRQWHYHKVEVDITNSESNSDLAQSIGAAIETSNVKSPVSSITVKLIGKPTFELNLLDLRALIQPSASFCLEDHFTTSYDLEKLASIFQWAKFPLHAHLPRVPDGILLSGLLHC